VIIVGKQRGRTCVEVTNSKNGKTVGILWPMKHGPPGWEAEVVCRRFVNKKNRAAPKRNENIFGCRESAGLYCLRTSANGTTSE